MTSLIQALSDRATAAVDDFYGKLSQLPKSRVILEMLDESELQHLKARQRQNLLSLADPGLKPSDHIETALRVGYESEAAFSKAFKRHFGQPPLAYRRGQVQTKHFDLAPAS